MYLRFRLQLVYKIRKGCFKKKGARNGLMSSQISKKTPLDTVIFQDSKGKEMILKAFVDKEKQLKNKWESVQSV